MDPTTNPVTNLKMEDDNTPLAEGAAEQARKSSRRKRKFKNKSKSKSKSKDHITEELPKGKQRRPHRKSLNLKPLIEESASKLRETKALDNLKLISMQLEDTSRMGTKNEFDSVFSSEFNRFEAESEKRDLRAARWKEQTNMLPYQHQYARLTNYSTPLDTHTDSEPLSRLSPEKVYTSEAKANTEFYDRSPDYSNDFNRTNYRQYLTTLGSKTLTPKENSVSTPSSNHSQTNIHNFSFNVQNSPLEENSKTIPERPNVPNPNILAFGVSQEPSHQNTGRILQKIRARTPDPTLPKIRTSRSPVDDRNEFLITKSVNTESIQNKKRKKDSETYPAASDNLSPLDRSWENLLANAELYSKKANPTDSKSAELKVKKETSMGSTYYLLNFPASIGKGPEPQSTTEGSMQPKYQRLHSKRDRTIVRDANGYRRPSGVPPRYQKLSSALKEIDSTYVYGAQPVNLQSLNEGIITFLKETYTQAPPHQRKGSLQKDNDFTPDSLPRSLSPLGDRQNFTPTKQTPTRTRVMSRRYESGITTERTNSVDVCKNQSTQIEGSYLQMELQKKTSIAESISPRRSDHLERQIQNEVFNGGDERILKEIRARRSVSPLLPQLLDEQIKNGRRGRGYGRNSLSKPHKPQTGVRLASQKDTQNDHIHLVNVIKPEDTVEGFKSTLNPFVFVKKLDRPQFKPPRKLYV